MTHQDAIRSLDAVRYSGKLQEVTEILEAYRREMGAADPLESARVFLSACDLLSSHDFGDYAQQARLLHAYAERGLLRSIEGSADQQLRLLAHLQHDYDEDTKSSEEWRTKRLRRALQWLRCLEVLAESGLPDDDQLLQRGGPQPPERELPHGVADHHVSDPKLRSDYRSAIDKHRQRTEEATFRRRLIRLYQIYEPLAAKYITSSYAHAPFDLAELGRLLTHYRSADAKSASSGVAFEKDDRLTGSDIDESPARSPAQSKTPEFWNDPQEGQQSPRRHLSNVGLASLGRERHDRFASLRPAGSGAWISVGWRAIACAAMIVEQGCSLRESTVRLICQAK